MEFLLQYSKDNCFDNIPYRNMTGGLLHSLFNLRASPSCSSKAVCK